MLGPVASIPVRDGAVEEVLAPDVVSVPELVVVSSWPVSLEGEDGEGVSTFNVRSNGDYGAETWTLIPSQ